jgi:hypothetical protein
MYLAAEILIAYLKPISTANCLLPEHWRTSAAGSAQQLAASSVHP